MTDAEDNYERWLIDYLVPDARFPLRIYALGWEEYSSHRHIEVRYRLASRRDCPPQILQKMWQPEYARYRKQLEKEDLPIDTRLMVAIADNENTPVSCLAEALGCIRHAAMVHLLACANPNAPMDVAYAHIHSYRWAALLALAYNRKSTPGIVRHIAKIPEDMRGGVDMNRELRSIARNRLGCGESTKDDNET